MKKENWFDEFLLGWWLVLFAIFFAALKALSLFWLLGRYLLLMIFRRGRQRTHDLQQKREIGFFTRLANRCDAGMKSSKWARRIGFAAFILVIAYFAYPPSHWGPWHRYQEGVASYYGPGFLFNRTANGDIFIPLFMTAAHKTLPLGSFVKVVNVETGKCVYVTINDRGPFVKNRIIDLSSFAGWRLGIRQKGTGKVVIYTKKLKR